MVVRCVNFTKAIVAGTAYLLLRENKKRNDKEKKLKLYRRDCLSITHPLENVIRPY
jgi:hypothetical protein